MAGRGYVLLKRLDLLSPLCVATPARGVPVTQKSSKKSRFNCTHLQWSLPCTYGTKGHHEAAFNRACRGRTEKNSPLFWQASKSLCRSIVLWKWVHEPIFFPTARSGIEQLSVSAGCSNWYICQKVFAYLHSLLCLHTDIFLALSVSLCTQACVRITHTLTGLGSHPEISSSLDPKLWLLVSNE